MSRFKRTSGIPLCACGCGKEVEWSKMYQRWNFYINGHNGKEQVGYWKGKKNLKHSTFMKMNNPMKRPEVVVKVTGNNHTFYGKKRKDHSEFMKGLRNNHWMKNPEVISKFFSREKHPMWQGGIACEPYCEIWIDDEYKQSIKIRDGNQCLNPDCRKLFKQLGLHHINYDKKNCHPWNLITICQSCNAKANYNRKHWQNFYENIMSKKHGYIYQITEELI